MQMQIFHIADGPSLSLFQHAFIRVSSLLVFVCCRLAKIVREKQSTINIRLCNYLVTVDLLVTIYLVIAAAFGALSHLARRQSVISTRGWRDVIVCATTA